MWGKGNTCALLVGELIAVASLEKNRSFLKKLKIKLPMIGNSTSAYLWKKMKALIQKDT